MKSLKLLPLLLALSCGTGFAAAAAPRPPSEKGSLAPDKAALERAQADSGLSPMTPLWLPAGYRFDSLAVVPYHGKKIIHYRYFNGHSVISLFQSPPRTRFEFGKTGRERVRVAGSKGFFARSPEGNVLIWTAGKNRLALVAPLELAELKKIAESIP